MDRHGAQSPWRKRGNKKLKKERKGEELKRKIGTTYFGLLQKKSKETKRAFGHTIQNTVFSV